MKEVANSEKRKKQKVVIGKGEILLTLFWKRGPFHIGQNLTMLVLDTIEVSKWANNTHKLIAAKWYIEKSGSGEEVRRRESRKRWLERGDPSQIGQNLIRRGVRHLGPNTIGCRHIEDMEQPIWGVQSRWGSEISKLVYCSYLSFCDSL